MPKYTFTCNKCNKTQQKIVGSNVLEITCSCGCNMSRNMPNIAKSTTLDVFDKDTGKKTIENQKEILRERKEKYFYEVEVPRLVSSGVYSIQTMLENGWVSIDDNGQIVINTKPPSKR